MYYIHIYYDSSYIIDAYIPISPHLCVFNHQCFVLKPVKPFKPPALPSALRGSIRDICRSHLQQKANVFTDL